MNRFYLAFFILSINLTVLLSGQTKDPGQLVLTLENAWTMMEKNNIGLKTLKLDRAALLREVRSLEQLIPGISAGAGLVRNSPMVSELTGPSTGETESDLWSFRGFLDLRLALNTGISTEEKIQLIQLELMDLEISAHIKTEKADLQKLYYEILTGVKNIQLLEENWTLANERLIMVESRFNEGLRSELEFLSARIAAARDLPTLQKARADQEKKWIIFREYINVADSVPIGLISSTADDQFILPDVQSLRMGLRGNENFAISELEIILAGLDRRLSRKDLLDPELGISLGWSSQIDPLFNSQSWSSENWGDKLNLSFSLSLPLDSHIKGSSGQLKLKLKEDSIQKAEWNREEIGKQLEGRLKSLLLDIELSKTNIELNELSITLQRQNFEKMRQNFENGRVSLLDLDDSRQELQGSLLAYEKEKLNLNFLAIELEQLTGISPLSR